MDSIVQAVIRKFQERSELGIKKYGVTLDRTDLKPLDWIQHAQDELMDGILYLERLKKDVSANPCTAENCNRQMVLTPSWGGAEPPPRPLPE
jgi:hypothetical protein